MNERVQSIDLAGPAGRLEALLHVDAEAEPRALAVICHPHPLYGGNFHNKVVHRIDRALFHAGLTTLRFNFRGVGASQGRFDGGRGEADDARAAIEHLVGTRERPGVYPDLPLVLAGFSFGAGIALQVAPGDSRVVAVIAAGASEQALAEHEALRAGAPMKPLLVLHGEDDELIPSAPAAAWAKAHAADGVELVVVPRADHFFTDRLGEVESAVRDFAGRLSAVLRPTGGRRS